MHILKILAAAGAVTTALLNRVKKKKEIKMRDEDKDQQARKQVDDDVLHEQIHAQRSWARARRRIHPSIQEHIIDNDENTNNDILTSTKVSDTTTTIPLHGGIAITGEYYLRMQTVNKQILHVQVDTGSSNLLLTGQGCASCPRTSSLLTWETNHVIPCSIQYGCDTRLCDKDGACAFCIHYGDGSKRYALKVEGKLIDVTAFFPDAKPTNKPHNVTARVMLSQQGNWPNKLDGILGLAAVTLSCNPTCDKSSSWEKMFGTSSFTMRLWDRGGEISFPAFPPLSPMLILPSPHSSGNPSELVLPIVQSSGGYYAVETLGLAVIIPQQQHSKRDLMLLSPSNTNAPAAAYRISIMDSGTTLLIVPPQVFKTLQTVMQRNFCHLPGVCSKFGSPTIFQDQVCLNVEPYTTFPDLILLTGRAGRDGMRIPPALYFIAYPRSDSSSSSPNNDAFVYCLAIQSGSTPVMIVGDAILRGYDMSYFSSGVVRVREVPLTHRKQVHGFDISQGDLLVRDIDTHRRIHVFAPSAAAQPVDMLTSIVTFVWFLVVLASMIWCFRSCLQIWLARGRRHGYVAI